MKKFTFLAVTALASFSVLADDVTVKTLYSAEEGTDGTNVTWAAPLSFEASEFEEGVNIGDYIYVTFSATTDVIEVKADGKWLPGSRFTWLGEGTPDFKCYITEAGLAALKEYGLELCGANFTVTEVSIHNDGFEMPEGAVWGGFFWVSDWNTLEIWKTAFANYNEQRYMIINLSEDNGDNTGYFMKVLTQWANESEGKPEIDVADNSEITKTDKMAIVDLQDVNLMEMLENVDQLKIQANPEGGNPFNLTSVVLTNTLPDDLDTGVNGIESITSILEAPIYYNLQGVRIEKPAKGLYIEVEGNKATKVLR